MTKPGGAEAQALDMLRFLATRAEAFERFLALSGLEAGEVAARAEDAELLAAVVDYLRSDEELAAAYCEEAGLTAEALSALRAALPGGEERHWL